MGCRAKQCASHAVAGLSVLLLAAAITLSGSSPVSAWVKPNLVCDGVDNWFGTRAFSPVDLMCLSQRLEPGNGSTKQIHSDTGRLVGRRVNIVFQVDTYNTSEDSHWAYDPATHVVDIRVYGDRLSPDMFLTKDAGDRSWWKLSGDLHGLMVRNDLFDGPKGRFVQRAVYVAEVGMPTDPARLGTYPFIARMALSPEDAALVRRDVVFEADGQIVAANGIPALHCGDLSPARWTGDPWGVSTTDCVFSVQFDYFALRLTGSGQVLSEWRRNQ
jgi:hypothetical protein